MLLEFEKTTSWKLNSEYAPLPKNISSYLHTYFNHYNNLLFRLLNITELELDW